MGGGGWSLVAASAFTGVVLVVAAVFGGLSEVQRRRWLLGRARRVIRLK